MSAETEAIKVAEEDDDEIFLPNRAEARKRRMEKKNLTTLNKFLGAGKRNYRVMVTPRYYGEILAWALGRYIAENGWQVLRTLGYHSGEAVYTDISTAIGEAENCLLDGQLLAEKDGKRYIITADISLRWRNSVLIESMADNTAELEEFIKGIASILNDRNYYKGKQMEFRGHLRFLKPEAKDWNDIILDEELKREITANSTEFLKKREMWKGLGIPPKRGILLAGEPGMGKTIICKALMGRAEDITCLTTSAYYLGDDEYITELYEIAQDLSPCMVFIEDIDLIGQERMDYGYHRGPALLTLLAALDGLEECVEVVTIATTNCLSLLDKAISQRPSRFDRVITLSYPDLSQRRELLERLCRKIPLAEAVREYIAGKTEEFTPAKLQEVVFGLVIENVCEEGELLEMNVSRENIDSYISRVRGKNGDKMGFSASNGEAHWNTSITNTIRLT